MKDIPNIYKETNNFEKRQSAAAKMIEKYNNKVPVVICCEFFFSKHKFLKYILSKDMECGYVLSLVRKNVRLDSKKGIFVLTENGQLITSSAILQNVYNSHKNEDLHLYLYVRMEDTFGG